MRRKRRREILGVILTSFLVATVGIAQEVDVAAVDDVARGGERGSISALR